MVRLTFCAYASRPLVPILYLVVVIINRRFSFADLSSLGPPLSAVSSPRRASPSAATTGVADPPAHRRSARTGLDVKIYGGSPKHSTPSTCRRMVHDRANVCAYISSRCVFLTCRPRESVATLLEPSLREPVQTSCMLGCRYW